MAAKAKTLEDLFHETLKDIYFAEGQVGRLEEIFELIRKPARGKTCDAILGILDEGKEVMEEFGDSPALDAGLLAGAQAVEHYEISRYGTLKTWASELGLSEAAKLLDETLVEEKRTDELLTELAKAAVNQTAAA
jgi:ferritin-like metal-binding protein YciE